MNTKNTAELWRPQGDSNPCYRRERANNVLVLFALFLSLLTTCGQSHAESYFILGAGSAVSYQPKNSNGLYYQDGYDHETRTRDRALSLGVGTRLNSWVRGEVNYHSPSSFDMFAAFIGPDQLYNSNNNSLCNGPCPPTQYGYYHEEKSGVSFTLLPGYKLSSSSEIYARIGVMYFKDSVTWKTTGCGDNCMPSTEHQFTDRDRPATRSFSACFGVGMQFGVIGIDSMNCPGVRLKPSHTSSDIGATDGIRYVRITMRKDF